MNLVASPGIFSTNCSSLAEVVASDTLTGHATAIRALGKRSVVADVIEIGRRLVECKRIAGHGGWLPWLDREFGWTEQTALNYIRVHEMAKSKNFLDFDIPVSGLYLLAAPSTSDRARLEVIERAKAGEKLSLADVKEAIAITDVAAATSVEHEPARIRKQSDLVGARLRVPVGYTATQLCRIGIELEASEGLNATDAAARIEMSEESYRKVRDIVRLSDRTDLSPVDAKSVQDAVALLDDQRRLARAFELISPVAQKVWGFQRGRGGKIVKRQTEGFERAVQIISEVCGHGGGLEIPHLTDEQAKAALTALAGARDALIQFEKKIKRARS